jgi:hypothetical protein
MRTLGSYWKRGAWGIGLVAAIVLVLAVPALAAPRQTLGSIRLDLLDALAGVGSGGVDAAQMRPLRQSLARVSSDLGGLAGQTEVFDARQQVQDVLTQVTLVDALSGPQLDAVRRELTDIGDRLTSLCLAQPPAVPGLAAYGDGWTEYAAAGGDVWPADASFSGWLEQPQFAAETDDIPGELVLTIDNGYTARWAIDGAYAGSAPAVNAFPEDNGDLYIAVRSQAGERDFLIEHGGIGPLDFGGLIPQAVDVLPGESYAPPALAPVEDNYLLDLDITVQPWVTHLFSPHHAWHQHEQVDHGGYDGPGHWNHGNHGGPGDHHGGDHQHHGHGNGPGQHGQDDNGGQDVPHPPVVRQDNPPAPPPPRPREHPAQTQPQQQPDHARPAHHDTPQHEQDAPAPPPPPPPPPEEHPRQTSPAQHHDNAQPAPHPAPAPPPPPPPPPPARNTDRQAAPPQHSDPAPPPPTPGKSTDRAQDKRQDKDKDKGSPDQHNTDRHG